MEPLLIKNGRILSDLPFSSNASPQKMDVLLRDGKIAAIGTTITPSSEFVAINANGLILTPGWIDIQLNGAFGLDFTESPDSIWEAARDLPKLGTTSFLPTIITSPLKTVDRAIDVQRKGPPKGLRGANALGLHLEGPFLNPGKKGAHNPRYLLSPDTTLVQKWTRDNGVYLATLAPELDKDFATTRRLSEQGVVVSIGHSLATYEQSLEALEVGIRCCTHLFNAQPGIEHRKPGLSIAVLEAPDVFTGIIVDGVHVHPGMIKLAWNCKRSQRLITVTDAISALGMPPGKYKLGDFEINVTETTVTLADGTLAGSNITQQKSLRNLMAWTGCSLSEAIETVTSTPAELLNLPNKGRITIGADADLVLITPDLDIKATLVGGEVLYSDI